MVRDYAKQQRYTFMGPIKVHLEKADDLDTGLYRVRSRTLASSTNQQAPGTPAPAAPPLSSGTARRVRLSARRRPRERPAAHAVRTAPGARGSAPYLQPAPAAPAAAHACGTGWRSTAPAIRSPARRW